MRIYLWEADEEMGPFAKSEILALLKDKQIDGKILARREDVEDWKPLDEVLRSLPMGLFSLDQIEKVQAALPPPVVVPDFQLSQPSRMETVPKRGKGTGFRLVLLLLLLAAFGFWFFRTPQVEISQVASVPAQVQPTPPPEASVSVPPRSAQPTEAEVHQPTSQSLEIASTDPALAGKTASASFPEEKFVVVAPTPGPSPGQPAQASPTPAALAQSTPTPPPDTATAQPSPAASDTAANEAKIPVPGEFLGSFFKIESVNLLEKKPKDGVGVWGPPKLVKKQMLPDFRPCLEVTVTTGEDTRSDQTMGKAYFFDGDGKLAVTEAEPSKSGLDIYSSLPKMPTFFYKEQPARFFFEVPPQLVHKKWTAVVVFGDKNEAKSACYPRTESDFLLEYPEKKLVYDRTVKHIVRRPAMNPLIEYTVNPHGSKRIPAITLLMRPPAGISDPSQVEGVLAVCYLGNLATIKEQLKKEEMSGDYYGLMSFANKHKLAMLVWGAYGHWNKNLNYNNLTKDQARTLDDAADGVAQAWEIGVKDLCEKYGIPDRNFLLWGMCGSAQSAHRLCLRKPEYFLAVNIHLAGSYDKPTPEASKVLWCVTTGEFDGGYERSKVFVEDCRRLGYPIIYKAIVGLGHAAHPDATEMSFKFFELALQLKEQRIAYDKKMGNAMMQPTNGSEYPKPWPEIFQHPPFYGDMINQDAVPTTKVAWIPENLRVPLPNKDIETVWARSN